MEDVKELCKRIIVIDLGKILYDGLLEDIVKKYALHKIIKVVFEETPNREKLSKVGKIHELNDFESTIYVPRNESVKSSIHLLENFSVKDFVVEEPPIEDIIRQIFDKQEIKQ